MPENKAFKFWLSILFIYFAGKHVYLWKINKYSGWAILKWLFSRLKSYFDVLDTFEAKYPLIFYKYQESIPIFIQILGNKNIIS